MGHVLYECLGRAAFRRLPRTNPPLRFDDGTVIRDDEGPVIFEGLTLERFLKLPEAKPALEYIDGKVVQKVSPKAKHSVLQGEFWHRIWEHSRPARLGRPYLELRCNIGGQSLVFDVCYFAQRLPKDAKGEVADNVFLAPDLVIEIISPGETIKTLTARLQFCIAQGVRLAWLVQPSMKRIFVFRPGQDIEVLEPGAILSGEDVLPGFAVPVAEVFDWLKED